MNDNPTNETQRIGLRLAALRKGLGLSQRALADMAGVGQTQVANTESALHSPSVETLSKMLNALGYQLAIIPQGATLVD